MLGLCDDESDLGWWVLNALHNLGLVKNLMLRSNLPHRAELIAENINQDGRVARLPKECEIAKFLRRAS
jgi:hypothetical protein